MSRFFERVTDDSSDSDHDTSQTHLQDRSRAYRDTLLSSGNAVAGTIQPENLTNESYARDLLLHALLEERCLHLTQIDPQGEHTSERIRTLADARYQYVSHQLIRLGLTSEGFATQGLAATRQQVRDGLDTLLGGFSTTSLPTLGLAATSALELGRLSSNLHSLQLADRMMQQLQPSIDNLARLPRGLELAHRQPARNLMVETRYQRDFEEIALLGRGGFGIVHHCKHKWDGLSYAIKRIPLSSHRLQSIQQRGQAEIDDILLELKTLAKLDHPNVVRYFSGWIELCSLEASISSPMFMSRSVDPTSHQTIDPQISGNVFDDDDHYITFGHSSSRQDHSVAAGASKQSGHFETEQMHRVDTRATVSDEDVESISRTTTTNEELSTMSSQIRESSTCLALHIQMGLYPFTLADILVESTNNASRHCFHLEPSARLLSALIDGVAYLHDQGIVHRDLKPANIFLSAQPHTGRSVCQSCDAQDLVCQAYKLRIGDFGLVTAVAQHDLQADIAPVGTELYQPTSPRHRGTLHTLDWYAVGMMTFELVWPFTTRGLCFNLVCYSS